MHILHVIESLEFGGAEKVVIHLANRLSENHKVTVCLVKSRGELMEELNPSIEVIPLDLGEGIHFSLPAKLRHIIIEKSVDIVNVHNWGIFVESCIAITAKMSAKLVFTVHGPYTDVVPGLKSTIKRKLRHYLERRSANRRCVGKIITVSDSIQEYITNDIGIGLDRLLTIHNGIDASRLGFSKPDGNLKLITVGRLAAIKNQALLIDALSQALKVNRQITLTIVGDGPERENLERQVVDMSLASQVKFLGFRNDARELVAQHDVFVLSSNYEGISIALLEAMSQALPSIATDVGGIAETIRDQVTGLLVPGGDVDQYALAILRLANNNRLGKEMGLNARQYFEEKFHENIVIGKYQQVYQDSLSTTNA